MTYKEAREYVDNAAKKGSILGLGRMEKLMETLGNPQNDLKVVHIAGTNGKGSTLAYLTNILQKAGYKVGRYTSPAVFDYLEIFSINDKNISEENYAGYMKRIVDACTEMKNKGFELPTAFEIETALAYLYFGSEKCELVLIETGMGGDNDATNVIKNTMICIISSISMDHMNFLGNTISEIAYHKAGIIKENSLVICAKQGDDVQEEVQKVVSEVADEKNADMVMVQAPEDIIYKSEETLFEYESEHQLYRIRTKMCGAFQPYNASTAIETAIQLRKKGFRISDENIISGIDDARWHGRFEKLKENPDIYFDGCHNPDAAKLLAKSMEIYFTNKKIVYIIGVLADKDYEKILGFTAGFAEAIITVTPDNARALDGRKLMETAKKYNRNVTSEENIETAVKKASDIAGKEGILFIFGSLSYLGEARAACLKI